MATPKPKPRDPIPELVEALLVELGEDPDRHGLKATPDRVSRALRQLTREIAEALNSALTPRGVGVVIEARHLCIEMRGVETPGGRMITSCMLGTFRRDARTRGEFLDLVRRP